MNLDDDESGSCLRHRRAPRGHGRVWPWPRGL